MYLGKEGQGKVVQECPIATTDCLVAFGKSLLLSGSQSPPTDGIELNNLQVPFQLMAGISKVRVPKEFVKMLIPRPTMDSGARCGNLQFTLTYPQGYTLERARLVLPDTVCNHPSGPLHVLFVPAA